jgi:hypothetical protein
MFRPLCIAVDAEITWLQLGRVRSTRLDSARISGAPISCRRGNRATVVTAVQRAQKASEAMQMSASRHDFERPTTPVQWMTVGFAADPEMYSEYHISPC